MPTVDQLFEEAMRLEPGERQLLAYRLMDAVSSAEGEPDEEWEEAWLEEIERRDAAFERGEIAAIPWEEVRRRVFGQDAG